MSIGIIAAAIAVFTGIGAGIGIGFATGKASEAIAVSRKPPARSTVPCCWAALWQKAPLSSASSPRC